jgi:hypothetical protein
VLFKEIKIQEANNPITAKKASEKPEDTAEEINED